MAQQVINIGAVANDGTGDALRVWAGKDNANFTELYGSVAARLVTANNLSDLANAATARTNLGVAIGTNVQAFDADLAALAANSTAGLWAITGAGTGAARTITGTANEITVANGAGTAGNPTLSLPAAITATGKTFTGGTFNSPAAITGLPDPSNAQDAATKAYVDSVAAGLDVKQSVICATTANVTLSGEQTLDGVLTSASRVLVKNQSAASQNGIYVSAAGAWLRATDMDAWAEVPGSFVFVEQGTLYADTAWVSTANAGGTIGSTSITWSQFAGAGTFTAGTGLSLAGTQFSIDGAIVGRLATANTWALAQTFTTAPVFTDASGTRTALGMGNVQNTADSAKVVASAAVLTTARNIDGQSFNGSADITVIAPGTHAVTSKATPVDADELPLVDSAALNVLKKLTWANLKTTLKTYFDSLYATASYVDAKGGFGFHNRVINPSGRINKFGSGTAADATYWFDQWVHLNQSNPVTPSQLSNVENGTPFMMRTTQSNASAQRFGISQPLESSNVLDLRGQTVTLSGRVRMSASTTLRYAIVEWTGTADSPTLDLVNDWTSGTFTPGNFFIGTTTTVVASGSVALTANTLATISLSGSVSGSMNNLHVIFWTDSTQAQNVTLDLGKVQLELNGSATPLALRSIQEENDLCNRYAWYWTQAGGFVRLGFCYNDTTTTSQGALSLPVPMRTLPAMTFNNMALGGVIAITSMSADAMSENVISFSMGSAGLTVGFSQIFTNAGAGWVKLLARM